MDCSQDFFFATTSVCSTIGQSMNNLFCCIQHNNNKKFYYSWVKGTRSNQLEEIIWFIICLRLVPTKSRWWSRRKGTTMFEGFVFTRFSLLWGYLYLHYYNPISILRWARFPIQCLEMDDEKKWEHHATNYIVGFYININYCSFYCYLLSFSNAGSISISHSFSFGHPPNIIVIHRIPSRR